MSNRFIQKNKNSILKIMGSAVNFSHGDLKLTLLSQRYQSKLMQRIVEVIRFLIGDMHSITRCWRHLLLISTELG